MEDTVQTDVLSEQKLSFEKFKEEVLRDYGIACESREASLLGRKEVLTGKAKFGIFGDGKEVPQVAMAKFFKNGDFRAGYIVTRHLCLLPASQQLNNSLRNYTLTPTLRMTHLAPVGK